MHASRQLITSTTRSWHSEDDACVWLTDADEIYSLGTEIWYQVTKHIRQYWGDSVSAIKVQHPSLYDVIYWTYQTCFNTWLYPRSQNIHIDIKVLKKLNKYYDIGFLSLLLSPIKAYRQT